MIVSGIPVEQMSDGTLWKLVKRCEGLCVKCTKRCAVGTEFLNRGLYDKGKEIENTLRDKRMSKKVSVGKRGWFTE